MCYLHERIGSLFGTAIHGLFPLKPSMGGSHSKTPYSLMKVTYLFVPLEKPENPVPAKAGIKPKKYSFLKSQSNHILFPIRRDSSNNKYRGSIIRSILTTSGGVMRAERTAIKTMAYLRLARSCSTVKIFTLINKDSNRGISKTKAKTREVRMKKDKYSFREIRGSSSPPKFIRNRKARG